MFGRSSEKSGPAPDGDGDGIDDAGAGDGGKPGSGKKKQVRRAGGVRVGGISGLTEPRFEGVLKGFPGRRGTACQDCGQPFTLLGDHWLAGTNKQHGLQVINPAGRRTASAAIREKRCRCPNGQRGDGAAPKAVGKGLFTNGFIAMLLTERPPEQNSLVTGLTRQVKGRRSPRTTTGGDRSRRYTGRLLAGPLSGALIRGAEPGLTWLIHADTRRMAGVRGVRRRRHGGRLKFWLWKCSNR